MNLGLTHVMLVGTGGFIGSVLRYALSGLVHQLVPFAALPYGTPTVNVLGCFSIGLLSGLAETRQVLGAELRLFLMLGVLGGFTTFSTFGYETLAFLRDGEHLAAGANVALSIVLCLVSVWAGHGIGSLV